jgi:hypothetical protein
MIDTSKKIAFWTPEKDSQNMVTIIPNTNDNPFYSIYAVHKMPVTCKGKGCPICDIIERANYGWFRRQFRKIKLWFKNEKLDHSTIRNI